jgi:type I restriction enzyme, S subunit
VPNERVTSDFLFYALRGLTTLIEDNAHGASALVHMQKWEMEGFYLVVPPRVEQERISEALRNADELIATAERLIAKKQAIKQGMMQQLLTGRTRLHGHTEPWKESSLGELCDLITDGTHYTPAYVSRGVPFYSVENITNDDFVNVKYISPEEHRVLARRCRPQRGDILMTRIGSLGETKYLDCDVDASIYVSLALLRPGKRIDGRYLYAFTKSRRFVRAVEDHSLLWAAPKKINMGDIGRVPLLLPSNLDEQRAIADIIFALEGQMKMLGSRLIKARAIKQGVMQQLLTGRTRLPVQEIVYERRRSARA